MEIMQIEAVILYSTNDQRFFNICIKNLIDCGVRCHVVTYSHMWNGDLESLDLLNQSILEYSENDLVNIYSVDWSPGQSPWYWEGVGRYLATQNVSDECDYILYIDIDEVVETEKFKTFIKNREYSNFDTVKLYNYWYFREANFQAHQKETSVVLCKSSIAKQLSPVPGGRDIYFSCIHNRTILGDQDTFIHHFSWVRTKSEMINKVKNWGHCNDKQNWLDLIEEEFSRDFNGTDFIHNYSYRIVNNYFNI